MTTIQLEKVWDIFFESMIVINRKGKLLGINRAAKRQFSLSTTDQYNTSIFELIPNGIDNYFELDTVSTGISITFGTEELLLTIAPIHKNNTFLLLFKNMTSSLRSKEEISKLKESIRIYSSILDKLDEGVCVIDNDTKILFYNKKMGEINTREPEGIKNKLLFEAFPNLEEEHSKLYKTLRLGQTLNHRETHFNADGKEITILSETFSLQSGSRKMGAVEILKDITKQKQLENTINQIQNKNGHLHITSNETQPVNNTRFVFKDIIFKSREMGRMVEIAKRSARTSSNILIFGETGTGKELFAQSIHNESPRKNNVFTAINCAALPESLLEGILFGTSAGSFTGASERAGIFEQAHKGTLLLDEINAMGLNLQAKLLRVIQERRVRRLGSNKETEVDVRIIATMNEDPQLAITNGRLREDLFYRIGVVNLVIQPLIRRKTDIPVLVDYFIKKHSEILGIQIERIDNQVMDFLLHYSWPGNVRQLEHTIEGALNLVQDEKIITFDHLPYTFQQMIVDNTNNSNKKTTGSSPSLDRGSLNDQLSQFETDLIKHAMKVSNGNITIASKKLGISRQNLNYKLKKFGISSVEYKGEN